MNGNDFKDAGNVNALNYHQKYQNGAYIPMTQYVCEYATGLVYNLPNPQGGVFASFKGNTGGVGGYSLHFPAHYRIMYSFYVTATATGPYTISMTIGNTTSLSVTTGSLAGISYLALYNVNLYVHSGTLTSVQTVGTATLQFVGVSQASSAATYGSQDANLTYNGLVDGIISPSFNIAANLLSSQYSAVRRSYIFQRVA